MVDPIGGDQLKFIAMTTEQGMRTFHTANTCSHLYLIKIGEISVHGSGCSATIDNTQVKNIFCIFQKTGIANRNGSLIEFKFGSQPTVGSGNGNKILGRDNGIRPIAIHDKTIFCSCPHKDIHKEALAFGTGK